MIRKPSRSQGCHSRKRNCRPLRVEPLSPRELLAADLAAHPADVSGDSQITPLDSVLVINAVQREESAAAMPAADLNADGVIDGLDIEDVVSALVESDSAVTLGSLPATTSGDLESTTGRSTDQTTTDFATAWHPLASAFPTATTPASSTIVTSGSIPLPGVTGPTPGANGGQSQITGAVRVATQYPEPMPLIYTNEDLVNDPNEDGFALYQGRVPFVVEVTYPDYDFAVDLNLEIYVALDGVERHYRSERVESYGGRHLTQFTIPTGAAESVKVRAELINNNLGLVGDGNALIAEGEKVETIMRGALDHVEALPLTLLNGFRNFIAEDAPGYAAKYILEELAPPEISIDGLMQELGIGKQEATLIYEQRLAAAVGILEAPLRPIFEDFAYHILLRPRTPMMFSVGESDDKRIDVLDLTEIIRREMERDAPANALKLQDLVYYEFSDAKETFKSIMGQDFQQFMNSGDPLHIDMDQLESRLKETVFVKRIGFRVPISGKAGEPTGEARLYVTEPSFDNPAGTGVGSGLDLRVKEGRKEFKIKTETKLSFPASDTPASVDVQVGIELIR